MRTILTPDVLKTMSCDEFEDWRDSGEDFRRELTHAVMRDLSCPENWGMIEELAAVQSLLSSSVP